MCVICTKNIYKYCSYVTPGMSDPVFLKVVPFHSAAAAFFAKLSPAFRAVAPALAVAGPTADASKYASTLPSGVLMAMNLFAPVPLVNTNELGLPLT